MERWIKRTKQPVTWLKWGADLRAREEYWNNASTILDDAPGHETNRQRYRTRLWTTVTPVKDLELNARLTWEFFNYCEPTSKNDTDMDEVLIDQLNIKQSNFLGLPTTWTVGRQDFNFGDGWLIMDGTPVDGSRTYFFDAIRNTTELKGAKTTVDVIYMQDYASSDHYLPVINDRGKFLNENDEKDAILYVTNKAIAKTQIDGYFLYKHDEKVLVNGDNADIYTFGGRVAQEMTDHWKYRAELAKEFGNKNSQELSALGFNSRLNYLANDRFKQSGRVSYEYLSGDNPDSSTNEEFDPLWGRWPQWSEVMPLRYIKETKIGYITNLQRVGPGYTIYPLANDKFDVNADYYLLFANQNTNAGRPGFSQNGLFRGQLLSLVGTYKFNEHLRTRVIAEVLLPGNYYSNDADDLASFFRYEIYITW